MIQTYEGIIDRNGRIQLFEPVPLPPMRRILITILNENSEESANESAMLSEFALAVDWLKPEEETAWSHLAQLPSL